MTIHASAHRRRWPNHDVDSSQLSAPRARFIDNIERLLLENRISNRRDRSAGATPPQKKGRENTEIKSRPCFVINGARRPRKISGSFKFHTLRFPRLIIAYAAVASRICTPEEAGAFGERAAGESGGERMGNDEIVASAPLWKDRSDSRR